MLSRASAMEPMQIGSSSAGLNAPAAGLVPATRIVMSREAQRATRISAIPRVSRWVREEYMSTGYRASAPPTMTASTPGVLTRSVSPGCSFGDRILCGFAGTADKTREVCDRSEMVAHLRGLRVHSQFVFAAYGDPQLQRVDRVQS